MAEQEQELVTVVVGEEREAPEPEVRSVPEWPVDESCAAAVELARETLLEEAPADQVGEHEGLIADGPLVVTHFFGGNVPGYNGWRWAVTLTRAPDSDRITVDETSLLPAGNALLAPAWVPWKQRIRSGDVGVGDVMVTEEQDARLIPGMSDNDVPDAGDDPELRPELWEMGLGRVRMLSPEGRQQAAQRWYREAGPRAQMAKGVDLECQTCGFLLLIGGPLGQAFGICANAYSPVDGRVVAMNFGCGAHSETPVSDASANPDAVIDELGYDDLGQVPEPEEPDEPEEPEGSAEPAEPAVSPESAEPGDTADAAETTETGVTGEADESAQSGDGAQPTAQDASAGEDQESEAAQQ